MLLDCEHCGAPLDVKPGAWMATCAYCQRTQRIKSKTKAVPTPSDWRAPTQWSPPPTARVHGAVLQFDPTAAARRTVRRTGCGLTLVILVVTALGLAPVFAPLVMQGVSAWRWDGSETFVCDGNGNKSIDGVKVKATARPAISVRGNCQLTITKSRITGDKLIEIAENGRVTVKDSELTMKRTLRVDGNFGIKLVGSKLRIEAEGDKSFVALEPSGNASVTLEKSELHIKVPLDAVLVVAAGSGNGTVELEETKVTIAGASRIVLTRGHRALRWEGGSLDAGGRVLGVDGPHDVDGVELNGSTIAAEGDTNPAANEIPAGDDVCAQARRCCLKVMGPAHCKQHDDMPPAGCAAALRAYRQAGQATGIQCD